MFRNVVTLLEPLSPILTKSNAICQRLVAALALHKRVWKWMLVACTLLLSGTYTVRLALDHNPGFLSEVICPIPIVRLYLPLCQSPPSKDIWSSKVISPQEVFATVMGRLGQDHMLATELVDHHFAVRDLNISVEGSTLERKVEIAKALQSLKRHTWQTGRSLSQFTTRFTVVVDTLHSLDEYALRPIEDRIKSDKRSTMRMFKRRILEAIYPLTGHEAHRPTEEIIKEAFRLTTGYMAGEIKTLVEDVYTLSQEVDAIDKFLKIVWKNVHEDIRLLPPRDLLGALWDRLAPADDYKPVYMTTDTRTLLVDLPNLYEVAWTIVRDILQALVRVQAELKHFDIERIQAATLLEQCPLEVMAATLRGSMKKLEAGKQKLKTGSGTKIMEMIRPSKNAEKNTKL